MNSKDNWSSFFRRYLAPHKSKVILYVFLSGWVGLHSLVNSFLTKTLIDRLEFKSLSLPFLLIPGVLLLINYELHNLAWRGIQAMTIKIIPKAKARMTRDLFEWVHHKPFADIQSSLSGFSARQISLLSEAFERLFGNVFVRLIRGSVQWISALILMSFVHPLFSLIFLSWTAFFLSFSLLFSRKIRNLSKNVAEKTAVVSGDIVDSLGNGKEVRIFSQIPYETDRISQRLVDFKTAYTKRGKFFLKFYFIQGLSITLLMGALLYFLFSLRIENLVSIGDFAFILSTAFFLTEMVWANTELIDQLNQEIGQCSQSLHSLFATKGPLGPEKSSSFAFEKGEILFDSISFGYSKDELLYENETIKIQGGEKVGLVGRSGAGKTTLTHLLLGLFPLNGGKILIDGQDITTLPSLHHLIGALSQDPSLFHRSLLENIRFGRGDATDEEVMEAGRITGVEEIIQSRAEGYSTLLGERGIKLSGGQKQRVALARVILKNAPILLLDEPSSQLDSLSETALKEILYPFMDGKTTIAIAHRFSTLEKMDRILVIDKGQVIQEGRHKELIKEEGIYRQMWMKQHAQEDDLILSY